ncbi:MAG: hypothetical protein HY270_07290 [Deltaproteobacteria bacterium]|nr:hypothetical protein [Deltaproteobacteria bacterium]
MIHLLDLILVFSLLLLPNSRAGAMQGPDAGQPATESTAVGDKTLVDLPSAIGAIQYEPGRGLRVGNTGLTLGGYTGVGIERPEGGPATAALDDLSLFVTYRPVARLHLFSELEEEDLLRVDDHGRGGTNAQKFAVERLYGAFTVSDGLELRFGQFLTPVGRWNVIHAQPLVWTTSRPLTTLVGFDTHTTGVVVQGALLDDSSLAYAVYSQFLNTVAPPHEEVVSAKHTAGARAEYSWLSGASIGASYLAQRLSNEWEHVAGIDAAWRASRIELSSEAIVGVPNGPRSRQWGGYVQCAWSIGGGLWTVLRYEHFDQRAPQREINLVVPALAYRPTPYTIFKLEYVFADHRNDTSPAGFLTSFSLLF